MVELVDTQDLKSCGHCGRAGSSPAPGTTFTYTANRPAVLSIATGRFFIFATPFDWQRDGHHRKDPLTYSYFSASAGLVRESFHAW